MKKLIILFLLVMVPSAAIAEIPVKKIKNPPIGTFKKKRNGTIVQYDKNGKKIGTYKINSRKNLYIK